jgi:hypothetical protein
MGKLEKGYQFKEECGLEKKSMFYELRLVGIIIGPAVTRLPDLPMEYLAPVHVTENPSDSNMYF